MKKQKSKIRTRKHYVLFADDSPFKAKTEMDKKHKAKRGYIKHKNRGDTCI